MDKNDFFVAIIGFILGAVITTLLSYFSATDNNSYGDCDKRPEALPQSCYTPPRTIADMYLRAFYVEGVCAPFGSAVMLYPPHKPVTTFMNLAWNYKI